MFSYGSGWVAIPCQLYVVDGLGSLGAYAFAHIVLRILSGMSGTWCSTVLLCTPIRVLYLDLFGPAIVTMQQFMWQDNLVRVAHFVFDCFASLQTLGGGQ